MKTPKEIDYLEFEYTCVDISINKWDQLMQNSTRANYKIINNLVKKHLPDLYNDLSLHLRNPYNYFKTKTHLILVHSGIEYFLRYKTN